MSPIPPKLQYLLTRQAQLVQNLAYLNHCISQEEAKGGWASDWSIPYTAIQRELTELDTEIQPLLAETP